MTMIHNGVELNQEQLDAVVPVFNQAAQGRFSTRLKLHKAIDQALMDAGCPVQAGPEEKVDATGDN